MLRSNEVELSVCREGTFGELASEKVTRSSPCNLRGSREMCLVTLPIKRSKHVFPIDMWKRDDDV